MIAFCYEFTILTWTPVFFPSMNIRVTNATVKYFKLYGMISHFRTSNQKGFVPFSRLFNAPSNFRIFIYEIKIPIDKCKYRKVAICSRPLLAAALELQPHLQKGYLQQQTPSNRSRTTSKKYFYKANNGKKWSNQIHFTEKIMILLNSGRP